MGLVSEIVAAITSAFQWLRSFISKIIAGILDFTKYVVDYFRNKHLQKGKDVPFIADAETFKDALHKAPTKNVGIFEGVYNEETNEIEHGRYLEADSKDAQTRNVLGNEKIVVLA